MVQFHDVALVNDSTSNALSSRTDLVEVMPLVFRQNVAAQKLVKNVGL